MSLERRSFPGIIASPGVSVGQVTVFDRQRVPVAHRSIAEDAIEAEVERLMHSIEAARHEVEEIRDALGDEAGADHRLLLETQLMMHGDELLMSGAEKLIREQRVNAEWALRRTVDGVAGRLQAAPEPYFRERAEDVRHVGEHVLRVLTGSERSMPELVSPTILVASDLSPAEAAMLSTEYLLGIVTDAGSASSHTAILARSLDVPAVVGVTDVTRNVGPGDTVIVDALRGEVIVAPGEEEQLEARARVERYRAFEGRLRASEERAAETLDGVRVALFANIELEVDVGLVRTESDGVGLYRTEFLYLNRAEPMPEDEQAAIYRRVARKMAPLPVTFRTFDLGADKMPNGLRRGPNPALGLRALRFAFEQPELLVTQLRAILRASTEGNVQVMFPMVSSLTDLRRAKVLFERAREDLDQSGVAYGPVPVGCMLEVPSAVIVADRLALECDFFSLGTNDLTQYTLAVDRGDPRVAHLSSSLDPAVLRFIDQACVVADAAKIPVSVCGDLAADPVATPVLLGLGLTRLSMATAAIPLVREVVSRLSVADCVDVAREALDQDSAAAVERLVSARHKETLGDLWAERGIELPRA